MMTKAKSPPIDVPIEQVKRGQVIAAAVDRKIAAGNLTDYERFLQSIGQLRQYLIGRAMRRG